jgi:uncharacterized phage protein (TIGR01671 family)
VEQMREILFRGKRDKKYDKNQDWTYGVPYIDNEGDCNMAEDSSRRVVVSETVGQYTGLTDKNGKKIFEGDIVKICLLDGVEIGQIIYSEMSCRFKFADKYGSTYGFDNTCTFEVIGNIHDNPELLKGGAEE